MATLKKQDFIDRAVEVLKENDRGGYTVPTKGLYPFQWNWDSCLTALGQRHFDEDRAWTEIETLFAHQWPDGMVPHIVFHVYDDGYFPGPDVWQTGRPTPTSGITQPAVAGFAIRRLYENSKDREAAALRARALLPKIDAWHQWFYRNRDPQGQGLVAIIHPWEAVAIIPSTGTRPSSACRPRVWIPMSGAIRNTPIPSIARPRSSMTAISGWCSISAASAGTIPSCMMPRPSRWSIPASTPSSSAPAPTFRTCRRSWRSGAGRDKSCPRPQGAGGHGKPVERGARAVSLPRSHHRRTDRQRLHRRFAGGLLRGSHGAGSGDFSNDIKAFGARSLSRALP